MNAVLIIKPGNHTGEGHRMCTYVLKCLILWHAIDVRSSPCINNVRNTCEIDILYQSEPG